MDKIKPQAEHGRENKAEPRGQGGDDLLLGRVLMAATV
jgi:hypothetical protein